MKKRIVIIGGGVIGLATAYELIKSGHQVRLLERQAKRVWQPALPTAGSLATGMWPPGP